MSTPYTGKTALWHWVGEYIPEKTIEEFAQSIKSKAPNISQIWVKTSDGIYWQGRFDSSLLSVKGPDDIDRWVEVLNKYDLEFHAWCVPKGTNVSQEAYIISRVCLRPGVKSMILDIEPYTGFWTGGKEAIVPFISKLRSYVGNDFHIGMSMDPRPWHYDTIYPAEWKPYIDSLHPQCYWRTFQYSVEHTLDLMYSTWSDYGLPIIPALQGNSDLHQQELAYDLSVNKYNMSGLSWWRYGVIPQYDAVNLSVDINTPPVINYDSELVITPFDPNFDGGAYAGFSGFKHLVDSAGNRVLYKNTQDSMSGVWCRWNFKLDKPGRYEISVFIPPNHSTTANARYKIHDIVGRDEELVITIEQSVYSNQWVLLGVFEFENNATVYLNDLTGESDKEIVFGAMRMRRIAD